VHPEVVRVASVQWLVGAKDELASRCGEVSFWSDRQYRVPAGQFLIEFEGAVLDEFGIESAIGPEVDVLEENAEHRGRNI